MKTMTAWVEENIGGEKKKRKNDFEEGLIDAEPGEADNATPCQKGTGWGGETTI